MTYFEGIHYLHTFLSAVPETPHHCHIANQTLIGIRVVCDTGFDGGLEQTFHMEVWGLADNVMYGNRSRDVPSFWATNLPPGLKVYIRVFSSNTKGRSTPVLLHAETSIAAGVSRQLENCWDLFCCYGSHLKYYRAIQQRLIFDANKQDKKSYKS